MASTVEWLLGFSTGPLFLSGSSHVLRGVRGHPETPTRLHPRLIGTTELIIAFVASLRINAASLTAVVLLYSAFVAFLWSSKRRGHARSCGCSVFVTSYIDLVTIGRAMTLLITSAVTLGLVTAHDIITPSTAWMLGLTAGMAYFVSLEFVSHVRWTLRTSAPTQATSR